MGSDFFFINNFGLVGDSVRNWVKALGGKTGLLPADELLAVSGEFIASVEDTEELGEIDVGVARRLEPPIGEPLTRGMGNRGVVGVGCLGDGASSVI